MKWNEAQLRAIETCYLENEPNRRCNILVNAAAGSGKTAVLVERIIRKAERPGGSDIDRLLVVTFTKAAAAEMQQKINRALVKRLENPDLTDELRAHLIKQIRLLPCADICNIDSYCMRVVRNNFHVLGVDPNFSPVSGGELEIMKDEAMSLLFEELYESGDNAAFIRLAEAFSGIGSDDGLAEIIKKLYNFSTSLPNPQKWFDEISENMENIDEDTSFDGIKHSIVDTANELIYAAAKNVVDIYVEATGDTPDFVAAEELIHFAQRVISEFKNENILSDRWGNVWNTVVSDFESAFVLYGADWREMYAAASEMKFASFPTDISKIKYKKGAPEDKRADDIAAFETLRRAHEDVKETAKQITEILPEAPQRAINLLKEHTLADTGEICRLVMLFSQKLDTLKSRRGVLEFCDIERLVYRLMADNPDIRREYNEKYDEVLIDEYQDVNSLQDAIFSLISNGENMFMVGDMKQSIYRFRNSDPTIFKHKTDTYHDEYNRVINLNRNYRSRKNVLDSINDVFSVIMSEKAGEIDYDDTQRLNAGDLNYEPVNDGAPTDNRSELVLISKTEENTLSYAEVEAQYVARRIKAMIDSGFKVRRTVTDEDGNQTFVYECVRPRDFAILASSIKGLVDIYTDALEREGVACYVETGGYFDRREVSAVLSIIKAVDNPLNDIPLVAAMRLPVCGFSDDELAEVRMAKRGSIYGCVREMSRIDTPLGKKCGAFLEMLENWRFCAKIMPCDKLIDTIYEQTDLYTYYGTLDNGEEAQANLRMLTARAREFEKTGFKGLFNFVRFVEKLKNHSGDYSEAKLISEEHDVVRMMTMHKSKGLEFPVVFIVGAAKSFLFDEGKSVCYHKKKGIGVAYVNEELRYCVPTILTKEIERQNRFETISERMRLWYVGMTRAKEKLIITATEKSGIKTLSYTKNGDNSAAVNGARTFFEWIMPIARADSLWKYSEIIVGDEISDKESGQTKISDIPIEDKTAVLTWKYPYTGSAASPAKISVTELKRRKLLADIQDDDARQSFAKPSIRKAPFFMQKDKPLTGAQIGTVVHYIMQTLPLYADEEILNAHIEKLVQCGRLTQKEADSADREKLLKFFDTDLAHRMQASAKVCREVPFEFAADSKEVYGFDGDEVIVQGIIDCYFEEDGEIVLLDFKTDYYKQGEHEVLADKYGVQLDNYARAVEIITKKRVKEKYLYLFFGGDVVECK